MKDNNIKTTNEKQTNESKNIGVKRDSKIISNNFIFRRVQSAMNEGTYEDYSNIYQNMFSFNWEDERLQKLKSNPSNYFISSFYYILHAIYFIFLRHLPF